MSLYEAHLDAQNIYDNHANRLSLEASVELGEMPHLDNGFAFVFDHRPDDDKVRPIPADEFRDYFRRRQVPIAAPDHGFFHHDVGHIRGYQWLFKAASVATMTQQAAEASVGDEELTNHFAETIDRLGDSANLILDPISTALEKWTVRGVAANIAVLSYLAVRGEVLHYGILPQLGECRDLNDLNRQAQDELKLQELHDGAVEFAPPKYFIASGTY